MLVSAEGFLESMQTSLSRVVVAVGINIDIDWSLVFRPTRLNALRAHKRESESEDPPSLVVFLHHGSTRSLHAGMNENVSILQLFPGIPASTVRTFLSAPMQGVVLETFGAGNPPQRKDLMDAIKEACDRGVVSCSLLTCAVTVTDLQPPGHRQHFTMSTWICVCGL